MMINAVDNCVMGCQLLALLDAIVAQQTIMRLFAGNNRKYKGHEPFSSQAHMDKSVRIQPSHCGSNRLWVSNLLQLLILLCMQA